MKLFVAKLTFILGTLCTASLLLLPPAAQAQIANGSISGRLTDSDGGVVPDAKITLTKTEAGVTLTGKTNSDGLYVFPALQTGTYRISVAPTGFRRTESQVVLAVGQAATLNLSLHVGSTTETVNVQAATTDQLNIDNSTLS